VTPFDARMQYEWQKRLQKPEILTSHIEEFLRKRSFVVETIPQADSAKVKILALPTKDSEIGQAILVEVSETSGGTVVDFASTTRAEESMRLGMLSQFLGGGILLAKSVSVKEKLQALETEFWSSLQEFISSQRAVSQRNEA